MVYLFQDSSFILITTFFGISYLCMCVQIFTNGLLGAKDNALFGQQCMFRDSGLFMPHICRTGEGVEMQKRRKDKESVKDRSQLP